MARATVNQGGNEAAVVAAVNAMIVGELNAMNRVPAASQMETRLRFEDRRDAGEMRANEAVRGPMTQGKD